MTACCWIVPFVKSEPFSRCLLCNRKLESGSGVYAELMPGYIMDEHIPCHHCPACAKLYREGSHVERMRRKLEQWNRQML